MLVPWGCAFVVLFCCQVLFVILWVVISCYLRLVVVICWVFVGFFIGGFLLFIVGLDCCYSFGVYLVISCWLYVD